MKTAKEYLKEISPKKVGFREALTKYGLFNLVALSMEMYAKYYAKNLNNGDIRENGEKCDCTHTQACEICAESKGITWDDDWNE